MKMKCYFLNGQCINIGEWDKKIVPAHTIPAVIDPKTKRVIRNEELVPEVVRNPIPEGVVIEEREITTSAEGGLYLESDYGGLRRRAYPPLADQLDALWKGGADADVMRSRVMAVKSRFPKPS